MTWRIRRNFSKYARDPRSESSNKIYQRLEWICCSFTHHQKALKQFLPRLHTVCEKHGRSIKAFYSNFPKAYANNLSANIKFSKTKISRMIQAGGFLGRFLGPLMKVGLRLMEKCASNIS